ncbi:MAG: RNA-binding S4 domain-containing protein [Pseudomonadota bacterium]
MTDKAPPDTQRIDRWLWCARFFKTRTLASKFIGDQSVRLTRDGDTTRIEKPSVAVRAGDTVTFSRNECLRIIDVVSCAMRRGPASEAATLYIDRSPPAVRKEREPAPFEREKGAGRPTKKDRRALDAIKPDLS